MSETPDSFDLEKARLALDREKWQTEDAIRREALALKRTELNRSRWVNPLVIAIFAAAVAALGNAGVTLVSSDRQIKLEREKAQITHDLNSEQSSTSLNLEKSKAEAARILEVVKTNDPDKAAENLKFLVDTGLIADPNVRQQLQTYLDKRKPGEGVVLPTPQAPPVSRVNPPVAMNCSFPSSYGILKVRTALMAALALPPLELSPLAPLPVPESLEPITLQSEGRSLNITSAKVTFRHSDDKISAAVVMMPLSRSSTTDLSSSAVSDAVGT